MIQMAIEPAYTQTPPQYQPYAQQNNYGQQQNGMPLYQQPPMNNGPINYNYTMPQVVSQPYVGNNPSVLLGRYVQSAQDIRPNEISMDGNKSFFPMPDGSCIFVKSWGADGTIKTTVYVPEKQEDAAQKPSNDYAKILNRLDSIQELLKKGGYKPQRKEVHRYEARPSTAGGSAVHTEQPG